jgi:hypothetical protein
MKNRRINYGFQGIEVDGSQTRRGLARRKLALHPEQAENVKVTCYKYFYEIPKIRALVRWLNAESGFLHPDGKWTKTKVKTILAYTGNTGTFFYGQAESVYFEDFQGLRGATIPSLCGYVEPHGLSIAELGDRLALYWSQCATDHDLQRAIEQPEAGWWFGTRRSCTKYAETKSHMSSPTRT